MLLRDKVILVTGASGGIGSAIVKALASEKAKLILHYSKDPEKSAHLVKILEDLGLEFMSVGADFKNPNSILEMFATIKIKFDHLDGLVNVSGIEVFDPDPLDTAKWKDVFAVDLFATVENSRLACEMMDSGAIVNISSIAGAPGVAFSPASLSYAVAKAAVNKFTEEFAVMVAPKIRVVGILPGYVLTAMWNNFSKEEKQEAIEDVPLKRFIQPEEIAEAVLSVMKNDAITGQNIVIDGGLTLREIT